MGKSRKIKNIELFQGRHLGTYLGTQQNRCSCQDPVTFPIFPDFAALGELSHLTPTRTRPSLTLTWLHLGIFS